MWLSKRIQSMWMKMGDASVTTWFSSMTWQTMTVSTIHNRTVCNEPTIIMPRPRSRFRFAWPKMTKGKLFKNIQLATILFLISTSYLFLIYYHYYYYLIIIIIIIIISIWANFGTGTVNYKVLFLMFPTFWNFLFGHSFQVVLHRSTCVISFAPAWRFFFVRRSPFETPSSCFISFSNVSSVFQ